MAIRPDRARAAAHKTTTHETTDGSDRPRTGANQDGAGSPMTTEQAVQEGTSMAHIPMSASDGGWVPRVGMIDHLPTERSALIRGLFEFAAWVADHPGTPVPSVVASIDTGLSRWKWQCRIVDQVAGALGMVAASYRTSTGTRYAVETSFGPVGLRACAISEQERACLAAAHSYIGAVLPVGGASPSASGGDVR